MNDNLNKLYIDLIFSYSEYFTHDGIIRKCKCFVEL